MKKHIIFPALVALVCGVGGYVWGQTTERNIPREVATADGKTRAKIGDPWEGAQSFYDLTREATTNDEVTKAVIKQALVGQLTTDSNNEGLAKIMALQAAQNQKIIQQNARIIELLEKQKN